MVYWAYVAKFGQQRGCRADLCERSPVLPHVRAEQLQLLQRDPPLPELRREQCWVCSVLWEGGFKEGNTTVRQQLREGGERWERSGHAGTEVNENGNQWAISLPLSQCMIFVNHIFSSFGKDKKESSVVELSCPLVLNYCTPVDFARFCFWSTGLGVSIFWETAVWKKLGRCLLLPIILHLNSASQQRPWKH